MNEALKKLLQKLGISAALIKKFEEAMALDEEALKKFDPTEIVTAFKGEQETLLRNTPEFINSVHSAEKGKIMEQLDRKLKQVFGLSAEDIKEKTLEEKIALAKEKTASAAGTGKEQLEKELLAANAKIKELEEVEIPKIKTSLEAERREFAVMNALEKKILKYGDRLKIKSTAIMAALRPQLSGFDIELKDGGDLEFKDAKTKLSPKNADGTKLLTSDEIIESILVGFDALKESKAGGEDEGKKVEVVIDKTKTDKSMPAHLNAAEKHLAEIKKAGEGK